VGGSGLYGVKWEDNSWWMNWEDSERSGCCLTKAVFQHLLGGPEKKHETYS
jgi:hypothetical protein